MFTDRIYMQPSCGLQRLHLLVCVTINQSCPFFSPKGDRVRSKIELLKSVGNTVDLSNFDFKTGTFLDGEPQKRGLKVREGDKNIKASSYFTNIQCVKQKWLFKIFN